jgi:3-oxoacyl-[acyl-carrier protein] reductase
MSETTENYLSRAFGLREKRAVVTGASRGIGRAIAEALAAAGAEVFVNYNRSKDAAVEVVAGIEEAGGKAWSVHADMTESAQVDELFAKVKERWGALDILVNNTGDLVDRIPIRDFSDEMIEKVLRVNLHSALYSSRAAIPLLESGKGPCIVNVGSMGAHMGGGKGSVLYCATKGAIHTYTRGLAKELAPTIRVNGVAPGLIYTDFHKVHTAQEVVDSTKEATPLKRLGEAEDIAGAAVFLCGAGSSFITGELIEINGGLWVA